MLRRWIRVRRLSIVNVRNARVPFRCLVPTNKFIEPDARLNTSAVVFFRKSQRAIFKRRFYREEKTRAMFGNLLRRLTERQTERAETLRSSISWNISISSASKRFEN